MAGEEWARRIVQKEMKRTVTINDNGSVPGMYDLRIGPFDAPEVAIECVGAVDQVFTETWNVGPARGPLQLSIKGDWSIVIDPKARVKVIKQHIEPLLREMEEQGIYNALVDHWLKRSDVSLFDQLESLGITHAYCYRLPGSGKVDFGMPGIGGAVDEQGDAVPKWVGEFLRDPARRDILCKLHRSGAMNRHAFIIVSFNGAPWLVESYLTGRVDQLPRQAPDLPSEVTGVWIVAGGGWRGLRWDNGTWRLFDARGEGIDDQKPSRP